MKKLFLVAAMAMSFASNAQTVAHTDSSLSVLGKDELVKIYINQVNGLAEKLPYSVWGYGDDLHGVDIPKKSKYLERKRKNMTVSTEIFTENNQLHMPEVIHYADKRRLVSVILYLQDVNSKIINVE